MDEFLSDSVVSVDNGDEYSDDYTPEVVKAKTKAPAKKVAAAKPASRKTTQTTLTGKTMAPKKRTKPESDHDDSVNEVSGYSNTPPSAKKQKKAAGKKSGGKPLEEIANDSVTYDDSFVAPLPAKGTKTKTATETYQKLTQLEHIIKRPDTYIGSVEMTDAQMWVYNKESMQMEYRKVNYVPGLYKIFDEILVNAADAKQRDDAENTMTTLKVAVDRETGEISVENNGKGIPVEMHEKEKMYIPQLIFGELLTGSNYDDAEKKTVGGRNGYGAKLCNIFSTEFTLECQDSVNCKRYKQQWTGNMSSVGKAKITTSKTASFVRISFKPDYRRFGMPGGIDDDLEALVYRRVYDLAGTLKGVKVMLNGTQLKLKNFQAYCELYAKAIGQERAMEEGEAPKSTAVFMDVDAKRPKWQIGFTVSDGTFQQISFVNSIATTMGGTHVNYITDKITGYLLAHLGKKLKGHGLKGNHIKNHIFIFINCLIDNPAFTSQTKEQMTTKASQFGSKCDLSEAFLKKIVQSDALQKIMDFASQKADKAMAKSDGSKRSRINNAKLVDANLAGTKRGHECTLILTEGDSAKSLAVAGRAILDPDRIGVFPLRGKMLNVRDATFDQISKNQEIQNIKQFLGLKHKQHYDDTKSLRYGHLMIMADQDHDGSHIKGLLINFLQVQYPSLLKIDNFFQEFITPIVKVWQGKNPKKPLRLKPFFTQPEYENWKELHKHEMHRWEAKYYKGLGTSSNEDAQVYFNDLDAHLKQFSTMETTETELFELVFSKKKADARKEWLGNFVPGTYLDQSTKSITYTDFVNKELILFSMADNIRSIPSIMDGFKPGQRKVIYACFKRNIVKDKKVIELAGYVSEQTAYHHGEVSLQQTIIGLAQNFVGSNNVNILEPSGNFGSRLSGGSDAASPRYIHTRLSPFARKVFSAADEPNLEVQLEDGKQIEPKVYAPVIPMVLVNGADGIGTGWSTTIPTYHPKEVVENLKRRMGRLDGPGGEEQPFESMNPWFRGWTGETLPAEPGKFKVNGIANQSDHNPNEIIVTELPVRHWTDDFKTKLEDVISGTKGPSWIKDYKEFNDHKRVHFEIMLSDDKAREAVLKEGILERFKLTKQVATTNLVAFDTSGRIRKYEKVEEILEEYYQFRFQMYTKRKSYWLAVYHADYRKYENQARFIQEVIDRKLIVSKKKKAALIQELRDRGYEAFPPKAGVGKKEESDEQDAQEEEDEAAAPAGSHDYDYLLGMPIWSLTAERIARLMDQIAKKQREHDELSALSEKDLWCADLDDFMQEWHAQLVLDSEIQTSIKRMGRRRSRKIGAGRTNTGEDGEYNPGAKKPRGKAAAAVKAAAVAKPKTQQRFAEAWAGAKPTTKAKDSEAEEAVGSDAFSDDDFMALGRTKVTAGSAVVKKSESVEPSEVVAPARNKRAAAAKAKTWVVSDDDTEQSAFDDDMLGNVGSIGNVDNMVKGIAGGSVKAEDKTKARLSLFAMSRPESQAATERPGSALPKTIRTKPSRNFDFDSNDDTNYELLAKSSPRKSVMGDELDGLLSDDDDDILPPKVVNKPSKPKPAPAVVRDSDDEPPIGLKKGGSRAAGAKKKPVAKKPATAKPSGLSPAAKAYAAKKGVKKSILSDDDDDDDDIDDAPSVAPKPKPSRGRPARSAVTKAKPIKTFVISSDEEKDDSEDMFAMDDESE